MPKFYGTPDNIRVGQQFINRAELTVANVHRPPQGGISGNKSEGTDSIVISGGYPDDEDHGDYIIYTGHGGRLNGKQVEDQSVDAPGNAGLITSRDLGLPVRVTRGAHAGNPFAPPGGLVYAGLFTVTDWLIKEGKEGFRIVQFYLERNPEQAPLITKIPPQRDPAYAKTVVTRRIRDTALSRRVKEIYGHSCQLCGTAVPGTGSRLCSEGAHVKPLGKPHLGSDSLDNILSLCPNHHTQLDLGGMVILDNLSVAPTATLKPFGQLKFASNHSLALDNASYHRKQWIVV